MYSLCYWNVNKHQSYASQHTHFPILFRKTNFPNYFGPFAGAPGAFAHHFRIPLFPLHILKIFRRFDIYFRFLLQGPSIHLLVGLVNICFRSTTQFFTSPHLRPFYFHTIAFFFISTNPIPPFLWRHRPYTPHETPSPSFTQVQDGDLLTTPRSSALPTLRNHLYPSIRRHLTTHTLSYTFSKNQIFKFLGGPFPGPQRLLPIVFEFPYSRYITSIFFPTFLPHFFMVLLLRSRRFDLLSYFLLHGSA